MTTFDAGTIVGRPGEPDQPLVYPETIHGPVQGYATVDGKRVAISVKRSTRGRELGSLGFFLDMSMNRVHSAREFVRAASTMPSPTNSVICVSSEIRGAPANPSCSGTSVPPRFAVISSILSNSIW